ncbi:DUF5694 domain-containing protein [Ekhidna sp. To15]|uniref:DUF5694 domain-containing protein n=1 Tax=Ekhidna sp. To15 TaxID=3395267 RepID=UPI003F51AEFF
MKTLFTLFLVILSVAGTCQRKLDITIIGTAHYFDDAYQSLQNFKSVRDFIVATDPDIICIEAIPTNDTLSLKEIWPNTLKRADKLKDTLKMLDLAPKALQGASFYASYDLWNAYYYWYQVQEKGDSLYYLSKFHRKLDNSEYGLMVFPAAQKLGIEQFYAIDYRDGESEFLTNNRKVLKKLLFGFKWKPLKVYLKTQKKYRKAQEAGRLMEFINSAEFQDSFSRLIDELPKKLPKSEEAKEVKSYWLKRNQIMADRLIDRAEEQQATKVLLTVGSAHIVHMKRFLEAKGHQVKTYGDFINNSNK